MPVDAEVANGSTQQTRTGNGNCIKVLILGVVVVVLGLTTILVCLRLSKSSLPTKRVDIISPEGLLNSPQKDDNPIINEADSQDKVDNMVKDVQENIQDLAESESSIEILKEVLVNMNEIISNDIDDPLEPFIETEVLENEMPTPRIIDLHVETDNEQGTDAGEVFDNDTDQNVPEVFLGEDSEEMSENPTLEEISKIVKKIIQSYKEKDDLMGIADDNAVNQFVSAGGTPSFSGEVGAAGTEHIVDEAHPTLATHNNHDHLPTNSNQDRHFILRGHRGGGSQLDKIGDHVFPILSEDNMHDDFAQRRGMGREDANMQHLNSRFPNSFTHSDIPQLPSHNSSVPHPDGNPLMEKLDDAMETTTKVVAMTTPPSETVDTAVAVGSPPSDTSNKAVAIESPPSETTNKASTIELLQSEAIGKALATDPPLIETSNKPGAKEYPPSETSNKPGATELFQSETIGKAFATNPLLVETSNKAVAIEYPPSEIYNKAGAIKHPPSETTNIAAAIEYPPIENTNNPAVTIKPPLSGAVHKAIAIETPPIATIHKASATDPSLWLLLSL